MKRALTLIVLFLSAAAAQAQFPCATDLIHKQNLQSDAYRNAWLRSQDQPIPAANLKSTAVSIPVVFHVLYNDPSQNIADSLILANLDVLNRDFAKMNPDTATIPGVFKDVSSSLSWQFCLASVDPQGNPTTGIVRKYTDTQAFKLIYSSFDPNTGGASLWPSNHYVNIIISNMDNGFFGWATYPVSTYQGINVHYSYVGEFIPGGGRLLTHEMGHYFNLLHIWGDQACGDDLVGDTPPQQGPTMVQPLDPCPAFPHITCSNGPDGDNFFNYMDYSLCASMFTAGQVDRMQQALTTMRSSLLTSPAGCQFPTAVVTPERNHMVYPNPSSGRFVIDNRSLAYREAVITDVTGRQVLHCNLKEQTEIRVAAPGIYFYSLRGKGTSVSGKLIVH